MTHSKVGYVFPMAMISILPHAELGRNDGCNDQESCEMILNKTFYIVGVFITYRNHAMRPNELSFEVFLDQFGCFSFEASD